MLLFLEMLPHTSFHIVSFPIQTLRELMVTQVGGALASDATYMASALDQGRGHS